MKISDYKLIPSASETLNSSHGLFTLGKSTQNQLLEIPCQKKLLRMKDPCVEIIINNQVIATQYFSKQINDSCLIDLGCIPPSQANLSFALRAHGLKLASDATVYYFEPGSTDGTTLIIAPHPDDGELACSSFYGSQTYLITLTSGNKITDLRKQYFKNLDDTIESARLRKGLLRAYNATTSGLLGGVGGDHMLCLGYQDASLNDIIEGKQVDELVAPMVYRKFNSPELTRKLGLLSEPHNCRQDLITEITNIINSIKPQRILVTNPYLEAHRDHLAAGRIFLDLAKSGLLDQCDLLFYSLHASKEKDLYFGPAGSRITVPYFYPSISLPKNLSFSYVSQNLNAEAMKTKAILMNTMYDLYFAKDHRYRASPHMPYLDSPRIGRAYYFRRFIKSNEVFLKLTSVDH